MTPKLKNRETVVLGLSSLRERLGDCRKRVRLLCEEPFSDSRKQAETVHLIRKDLKALRAGNRLFRDAMPARKFRRRERRLRQAGQSFAQARQEAALVECIARLERDDGLGETHAAEAVSQLEASSTQSPTDLKLAAQKVTALLLRIKVPKRAGRKDTRRRLVKQVELAREELARCRKAPQAEALHELRKQVKSLHAQLLLLQFEGPTLAALKVLADLLGERQDLDDLRQQLASTSSSPRLAEVQAAVIQAEERLSSQALTFAEATLNDKALDL